MNKKLLIAGAVIVLVVVALGLLFVNMNEVKTVPDVEDSSVMQKESTTTATTTATGSAMKDSAVQVFTVEGSPFKFSPNNITVNQGDKVKIIFKNVSGKHDLVIDEFDVKTDLLSAGGEESIEFVADKKGTFEFYCSVGNHRAMGMVGTLTVN